jgi:hypothetical protein
MTLTGTTQTISTGFTNPDTSRTIGLYITAPGDYTAKNFVVHGTDDANASISDTIAGNTGNGVVIYAQGVKAFKTVTSIDLPTRINVGDTISLGVGTAIGLKAIYTSNYNFALVGGSAVSSFGISVDPAVISLNTYGLNYSYQTPDSLDQSIAVAFQIMSIH